MKGQAGQMLNLKALSDIALENVLIGSKMPRSVLLGESQVTAGRVYDPNFYGLLDIKHTELESFVMRYFIRDINIRKLLMNVQEWEIDWGIRLELSQMDQMEYDQRKYSNALALTTICTVNECRKVAGFPPLPGPEGELIMGVDQMLSMMGMGAGESAGGQSDEAIAMGQQEKSTENMSKRSKDLEKDKTIQKNKLRENKKKVKDAIDSLRGEHSAEETADILGVSKSTLYKIIDMVEDG
jgi:hypothetical protein